MGSSFGFIAPITAVTTANKGIAVASFGIMVTGILLALVGVLVHYAGSNGSTSSCRLWSNGAIVGHHRLQSGTFRVDQLPSRARHRTGFTLLAVLLVAVLFKGLAGPPQYFGRRDHRLCICSIRGQVDFSAIGDAAWIGFPKFHLPQADFSILPMFIPVVPRACG